MAQVVEGAAVDGAAEADDAHPVAERLDLGEDVAREEHGPSGLPLLGDALAEHRLHQRIEPRGRLVEDEQLDIGGESRDQRDLLAVALRVGAAPARRVEVEALEQPGAARRVQAAAQPSEQVDDLAAGQRRPEGDVPGDVGEPPVEAGDVSPGVATEHLRGAAVGAEQAEQDADGGRLAGAVGPEEAVHLAGLDAQVEAVERPHPAEALAQAADRDRSTHEAHATLFS